MTRFQHTDNGKQGEFTLFVNDENAGEITYRWLSDKRISVNHTGVKPKFRGQGLAEQLILQVVEFARKKQAKIKPVCSYVKKLFEQDEKYKDVR